MGVSNENFRGRVQPGYLHITNALIEEENLELQIQYVAAPSVAPTNDSASNNANQDQLQPPRPSLFITMYGPMELYDEIGEFFQSNDIFLQDPANCSRIVRYCNPHRLSSADPNNYQWTSELSPGHLMLEMKDISAGPDIIDLLDSEVDLAETPQPPAIETLLKK
jgi:hypothetical protein